MLNNTFVYYVLRIHSQIERRDFLVSTIMNHEIAMRPIAVF